MTCPKQLRNGPCGGVAQNGDCEVFPGQTCVWVTAAERARATGHEGDLALLKRPLDHRRRGTSSWLTYWQGRDDDLTAEPGPQWLAATIRVREGCRPGRGSTAGPRTG
jgi:hypothetical protein